jgi:stringent starvation protein B
MTSNRPYLIRAIYEWLADNNDTPYLVVNASVPGVRVPQDYIQDGQIVLNIAFGTVKDLVMGNRDIQFSARFKGQPHHLVIPVAAVKALYGKDSGKGMGFDGMDDGSDDDSSSGGGKSSAGGHLRIVK